MYYSLAAFLGAIVGSFLNVCIFRIPNGESIVFPASHCPRCKRLIAPIDNIPVISFLFLKGHCRHCKTKISWQYPVVELLTAGFFILFYHHFGVTIKGVWYLVFSLALLVETFIDLRHQIIPDTITLPGIVMGLALSALFPALQGETLPLMGLFGSFVGALAGGGFLFATGVLAEWILKKEALGGGDIKLLAMIGATLGWQGVVWTIFVSSLMGSAVGLYLRMRTGQERIPFGPYLAAAALFYIFFGNHFILWYVQSTGV